MIILEIHPYEAITKYSVNIMISIVSTTLIKRFSFIIFCWESTKVIHCQSCTSFSKCIWDTSNLPEHGAPPGGSTPSKGPCRVPWGGAVKAHRGQVVLETRRRKWGPVETQSGPKLSAASPGQAHSRRTPPSGGSSCKHLNCCCAREAG